MFSTHLSERAEALVTQGGVFARLIEMIEDGGHEAAMAKATQALIKAHKRAANEAPCACVYCAAIKDYVDAKLRVRKLERELADELPSRHLGQHMNGLRAVLEHWRARLFERVIIKDRVKAMPLRLAGNQLVPIEGA